MKLLIVNDEILTADTLKADIDWKKYGISQVYLAYDAREARQVIERELIDILLCDIEMPEEDGISLMRWVRDRGYDVEGIFLTCHANFAYAQEAVKLECQDYVLMPARNEEIGSAVSNAAGRAREKRKNRQLEEYGERWLKSKQQEAREMQGDKREPGEIVAECIQYILDNLDNTELSVNKVASHCYLNPIYLNRIFKKEKEFSIGQFIIREKMVLAARLLQEGGLNAATVAAKVGYLNYPYFSTAFKKYFGCSPQQYKEEMDKTEDEGER